ncbi:hypothetical protein [Rhizohabitans arisaemae]|uniref:hypothetical protein n=1 Tax=Rhizohabitans arisaemae TaxID=2720610 RepID=UPI0024B03E92|nr:hypothetical protein [Rhizohabitans arisaemae]
MSIEIRDLDALYISTHALKHLGSFGRACVHPAQIPVVNEVFTPPHDTVAVSVAQTLLSHYEKALASGLPTVSRRPIAALGAVQDIPHYAGPKVDAAG